MTQTGKSLASETTLLFQQRSHLDISSEPYCDRDENFPLKTNSHRHNSNQLFQQTASALLLSAEDVLPPAG